MALPRDMAFARRKVSEAWKRLKVNGVSKAIAEAKINTQSKQGTNENAKTKKSVKISLFNIFQLKFGVVSALENS